MSDLNSSTVKARFLASYGLALFLLVTVSLSAHVFIERIFVHEREAATTINVSGAQRMLSQRTLVLANYLSRPDDRTEERVERLVVTLNRFEAAHQQLRTYSTGHLMDSSLNEGFAEVFSGPEGLDRLVDEFVSLAEPAITRPLTADELLQLETMAFGALFEPLDAAVSLFQQDAENGLEAISEAHLVQFLLIVLVLVGEALFIFWPLTRRLFRAMKAEAAARQGLEEVLARKQAMEDSRSRFIATVRMDFLEPMERMSARLTRMLAGDEAAWPILLKSTQRELDETHERAAFLVSVFDGWQKQSASVVALEASSKPEGGSESRQLCVS